MTMPDDQLTDHDAAADGPLAEREGRWLRIGAAQLGPIGRHEPRSEVVDRLIALLHQAASAKVDLIVYPELALTTFFPRWFVEGEDDLDLDSFYETEMPGPETKRLFDEAKRLAVGFCLGYAELTPDGHRYNTQILVERDGSIVGKYHKVHLPGHREHEPWREFQHLERRYFEPGNEFFVVGLALGAGVFEDSHDGANGVDRRQKGVGDLAIHLEHRIAHQAEQVLRSVSNPFEPPKTEKTAGSLDRVEDPKNLRQHSGIVRGLLQ